jgi:hypothetical protein
MTTDSDPTGSDPADLERAAPVKAQKSRILLGLGLVALLVTAVGVGISLRSSAMSSGGAATAEEAVNELMDAIGNEDAIALAELLLPSERATMIEPLFDMVSELQRLEVLDREMKMSAIPGVDFEFADLTYEIEPIREDMSHVTLTGGIATSTLTLRDAPLGRLVLDRLPAGTLDVEPDSSTQSINRDGFGIVVVERDGRWFVSVWYTAAEAARIDARLPLPDLSRRINARGAESAETAVEEMMRSALDFDIRRMLELLPPGEAEALHDYAPLFIDDVEAAAKEARSGLVGSGLEIDLTRIDLSSTENRGGRTVSVHGGAISVTSPDVSGSLDISADGAFGDFTFDGTRIEASFVDGCVEFSNARDGEVAESETFCEEELGDMLDEQLRQDGLGLPDLDIFSERPEIGIKTVEVDGLWYLSPLGTMNDMQIEILAAIDQEKLEVLIDWIIDASETVSF